MQHPRLQMMRLIEHLPRWNANTKYEKLNIEERNVLRLKLCQIRKERREGTKRRIVFFADGQFKCTLRGNPSMPKKKLLKLMAVRGLTILLDEYKTSKMCPCGHAELGDLKTTTNGKRVRVHKTDGGVCGVLKWVDDRDETATIQQLLASGTAMNHTPWPSHLLRPPVLWTNIRNINETHR